jgi:hypothetical protein
MALLVVVAAGSCTREPKSPEGFCRIEAVPIETRAGGLVQAKVRVVPEPGFRWNPDFVARARITNPGGLAPDALWLGADAFTAEGDAVVLTVPVTTASPGAAELAFAIDFSICSDSGCQVFRGVPAKVPFQIR